MLCLVFGASERKVSLRRFGERRPYFQIETRVRQCDVDDGTPDETGTKLKRHFCTLLDHRIMLSIIHYVKIGDGVEHNPKGVLKGLTCRQWKPDVRHRRIDKSVDACTKELRFGQGFSHRNGLDSDDEST